jgi:hypothetical protein
MTIASDLAQQLAERAEAVCRHYLSNGRRAGRYWIVGDTDNTPGRSLFVRLTGPQRGAGSAGKWTDAATGEHGDLLDLIASVRKLGGMRDTIAEARAFLGLPHVNHHARPQPGWAQTPNDRARRLWAIAKPISGTVAQRYLASRGLHRLPGSDTLRFHPACWYRPDADDESDVATAWPALIAGVRNGDGQLTGVHRTFLVPDGSGKAAVATPRRALGHLAGNGVRIDMPEDVLAAGEGLETMLSLRQLAPRMPAVAALSAVHLAALTLPATLRRLYLALDWDDAGRWAGDSLAAKARSIGAETVILATTHGDLNDALRKIGADELRALLRLQFAPVDVERFLRPTAG